MISLGHAPRLSPGDAERIAADVFGIEARARPLPSERDQNFRLDADGRTLVLKVANRGESLDVLEAENAAMRRLEAIGICPVPVPPLAKARPAMKDRPLDRPFQHESASSVSWTGEHYVRLITWLPGRLLGEAPRRPATLLADLGRRVGEIDRALAGFDHPALHRSFQWDLTRAPELVAARVSRLRDRELQPAIERCLAVHRQMVAPRLPSLRRGIIHGDVNDYNVLVDTHAHRVTGIVDFGDMLVSHVVNDLAIAMAYAALGTADPVGAAAAVAGGYYAAHPLTDDEIAALYGLMCLRLCLSVCIAAEQRGQRPDDEYLAISQPPIRETLPRLVAVHPRLAHYRFREACGLVPVPHMPRIVEWLRSNAGRAAPVVGHDLRTAPVAGIDLSAGSPLVASNPAENAAEPLARRIFRAIAAAGAVAGAGGYDEARLVYPADVFVTAGSGEPRTIHLGLDLTMPPGSPVHTPLAGVVHGFEDTGRYDYGPVIVLRHEIPGDEPLDCYTLYGHLERRSLEGLSIGRRFAAGERIGAIGPPPENGDWWPHLHVQIITDMLDVPCNFNGVAAPGQRATWLSLSPDPNLILGIPPETLPRPTTTADLAARRRRRLGANVRVSYGSRPLQIVRGWMQYLFDETGRRYLDAYNNVPHVGHSHPRVTEAVAAQLATLNTNTRYLHETIVEYADALTAMFPTPLEVCFFTASGSEANELALRLARAHTRRRDLIVLDAAYHGHTTTMIDVSPYKHGGPGGDGAPDWVHVATLPDVYRGPYRADDAEASARYARDVAGQIEAVQAGGGGLCGFLAETCPSVGGQIVMPSGYLPAVYRAVRAAGGVCMADEVQTGFGRLGTHFWAFQAHDVVPDIVVLGKPIANGYPMGAVVTTRAIADSFDNGMEFFSTFGGSTGACAAAMATLRVTLEDGLQAHARAVGDCLLARLRDLQGRHRLVGDVRGSGLFIGVELVTDRDARTPAAVEAADIVLRMRDMGVLVGTDGPHHNVIKVRGPMPLTRGDAGRLADALDVALDEVAGW